MTRPSEQVVALVYLTDSFKLVQLVDARPAVGRLHSEISEIRSEISLILLTVVKIKF